MGVGERESVVEERNRDSERERETKREHGGVLGTSENPESIPPRDSGFDA